MKNTGERLLADDFNRCALEHIHRYAFALEFVQNKIVIDIASGEGYGSNLLATKANYVTGIDISREAVEHSKNKYKKKNLSFLEGSTSEIPLDSQSVDVVVSFETIEHHDKHDEMMIEIKRVLKPDGMLIISSPDKNSFSKIPNFHNDFHIKELYLEEFKNLLSSYFSCHVFFSQKICYSSLIVSDSKMEFYEFSGDFNEINKQKELVIPYYNIAIASMKNISGLFASSFNGDSVYESIMSDTIDGFKNSYSYKIGRILIKPFSVIKQLFAKSRKNKK
ncbi:MAG: hypothetical protein A2W93_10760 [Bacteroidetes bacterium GWF2_43_63]|nr:MAG: hypothetical protein A2W94_01700 [Bacteroidetes bacterium GWE2_42_42]OFY52994.1 MAG: hypothetical protein A2W93_10760 [Bacteroidetes bacterium GWF2_43_63]HCB62181.1 hypothetical protein [Bacteroidales bacterium]